MDALGQIMVASSWKGRLCRSLPSEVNIFKSLWLAALAEVDRASWHKWFQENNEPEFQRLRIGANGFLRADYTDRFGRYHRDVALGIAVPAIREEFSRVCMALLFEPHEMQDFYNHLRFLLRHDAREDKTLIYGFTYTGTNSIVR